jgi:hypothetical protein
MTLANYVVLSSESQIFKIDDARLRLGLGITHVVLTVALPLYCCLSSLQRRSDHKTDEVEKSNMMATSRCNKPLVVLAGWLGSTPKQLRRYEDVYKEAGFQVLSRIATPQMVVNTAIRKSFDLNAPPTWPRSDASIMSQSTCMNDLAWDALAQIHQSDCNLVLFHVFSNGGCFLWELISRILGGSEHCQGKDHDPQLEQTVVNSLSGIRSRVGGVVFDSCPGANLHRLGEALAYCSPEEQINVLRDSGANSLSFFETEAMKKRLHERELSYIPYLRTDDWCIPQLYLYSQDDPLARPDVIDDLVSSRKQLFGEDMVVSKRWDSSSHCKHLLKHPQDYQAAVKSFISFSISNSGYSRL